MKKEISITVPKAWSAITLKKYLQLQKDMEAYKEDEDAVLALILHHLCEFDVNYIPKLDIATLTSIKADLASFLGNIKLPLQQIITLGGVEYGFEPNLSKMSYGAYVDISKYDTVAIDDNWAEIMSILYRPVRKKIGKLYEVEPYKGEVDKEKFQHIGMDVHLGAVFFFRTLLGDLVNDTLNSLITMEGMGLNIKSILERNGNPIPHLFNSPEAIYSELMKLRNNH